MTTIRNYEQAAQYLGTKAERPLENNTRIRRRDDNAIVIRLHSTDIITYFPAEAVNPPVIVLNSGGWLTSTTKARLNTYGPPAFRIWQERGQWKLYNWETLESWPWAEGITIDAAGVVYNAGDLGETERIRLLNRDVRKYVKGFVTALLAGKIPAPGAGDCWACNGVLPGHGDHIQQHVDESYYVPSLLVNAIDAFPVSIIVRQRVGELLGAIPGDDKFLDDVTRSQVTSSLTRYLKRELGIAR